MSNEEHPGRHGEKGYAEGPDPRYEGWEPTPRGDGFDADATAADATAFVQLPPEDLADIPLAAPGHGYVPPMIVPLTPMAGLDPAVTGSWVLQTQTQQAQQAQAEQRAPEAAAQDPGAAQESGAVRWPDPNLPDGYAGPYADTSHATAQWNFAEVVAEDQPTAPPADDPGAPDHSTPTSPAAHTGHTGQWTIPVATGELPDESGEFPASAPTPRWYTDTPPPATLPGGARAPWATPQPDPDPVRPEAAVDTGEAPQAEADPEPPRDARPEAAEKAAAADTAEPAEESAQQPSAEAAEAVEAPQETAPEAADAPPPEPTAPRAATAEATTPDAPPGTDPATPQDATVEEATAEEAAGPDATAPGTDPESAPDVSPEAAQPPAPAPADAPSEHPAASYVLHVNGVDRPVGDAWIGESLLYVLRERLGLAGAKDGCSQGECGACNVQVDGRLVASCLVPAATTAGSEVRTVEGLAVDGEPSDVQRALSACGAVQCGFCIPGMAMTVHDLLEGNHAPTELETRAALCGNLCRCSGYRGVLDAVADVVAGREASAAAAPAPEEARIPHQAEPGEGGVQQPYPHEGDTP
ncbi:2Fe-2S iron-sulfur cluster-binding protein [Streptomyces sp. NPDC049916]|uniref:2Fe-2S iron-sulfur cluster-binding protein n=1 Tax=Streptomyces sp. NPDC049916 TaxID=3155156 RepID=UPI003443CE13